MPSIQPQPLFVTISLATTIQVASTHLTRGLSTAAPHVANTNQVASAYLMRGL